VAEQDDSLCDSWMGKQIRLDFTGFDAKAPQFDLLIDAAMEGEGAIGVPGGEITRFVDASSGIG
jgi:hypothetical protein